MHARQLAFDNELADEIEGFKNGNRFAQKYEELLIKAIENANNFREIQSIVPTLLNQWEEESWNSF